MPSPFEFELIACDVIAIWGDGTNRLLQLRTI